MNNSAEKIVVGTLKGDGRGREGGRLTKETMYISVQVDIRTQLGG